MIRVDEGNKGNEGTLSRPGESAQVNYLLWQRRREPVCSIRNG